MIKYLINELINGLTNTNCMCPTGVIPFKKV